MMPETTDAAAAHITVRSPITGEVLGSVPVLDQAAVAALVARARSAQPAWAGRGISARADLLLRFRARLAERAQDAARISCAETGKLPLEALLVDVQLTCDLAKWYARRAQSVLGRRRVPVGWLLSKRAFEQREPYGVVGVIGPWNLPIVNCMRAVLAGLVAGNTVVLKPSEASPLSALLMREIASEAGIPEDVFLVATGEGPTGAALVAAAVDKISLTGSVETGIAIARAAAERLLPLTLELGGKDPMIVLAGANIERAADAALVGAFANTGQICTSIERVYVEEKVYEEFLGHVVAKAENLRTGPDADVGAVTVEDQRVTIEAHLADAVARGAQVLVGGGRPEGPGRFVQPTVLANVSQDMRVMREETFGPVLPIMKVRDAEEALALANDSPYALGGSIWGRPKQAQQLVPRLQAGMVAVNDTMINGLIAALPFGGLKQSGYGRVYGDEALREMSWARGISVDRFGIREVAYDRLRWFGPARALGLVHFISGSGVMIRLRGLLKLLRGR